MADDWAGLYPSLERLSLQPVTSRPSRLARKHAGVGNFSPREKRS